MYALSLDEVENVSGGGVTEIVAILSMIEKIIQIATNVWKLIREITYQRTTTTTDDTTGQVINTTYETWDESYEEDYA